MNKSQKDTLKLIERSPKDNEGWAKVSKACMSLLVNFPKELAVVVLLEDGSGKVKLTAEGMTLIEWMD